MKSKLVQLVKFNVGDKVVCTSSMPHLHNDLEVGDNLVVVLIDTDNHGEFAKLEDKDSCYYVTLGDLYLNFEHVDLV